MATIASPNDVRAIRGVSFNLSEVQRILPCIEEAEKLDVMPVISPSLYFHLVTNPPKIQLPKGCIVNREGQYFVTPEGEFIHVNEIDETAIINNEGRKILAKTAMLNRTVILNMNDIKEIDFSDIYYDYFYDNEKKFHSGLLKAIGYFAYSRLLRGANVNVSAFGASTKISEYSTPVLTSELQYQSEEAREIGEIYLKQVVDYLDYLYCYPTPDRPPELNRDKCDIVETKRPRMFVLGD